MPLLLATALLVVQEVQSFIPFPSFLHSPSARLTDIIFVAADDGDEPELILGGGVPDGSDPSANGPADYLSEFKAASAKRNEEAKRLLLEEEAREEEEARARQKAREEGSDGPNEANYGPGDDLSSLPTILTNDDSWEASLGDDDSGLMVDGATSDEGNDEDGPSLYVPGVNEGEENTLFIPTEGGDGDGDSPILF